MFDSKQKQQIWEDVMVHGKNKTETARKWGTSARTVGRIVASHTAEVGFVTPTTELTTCSNTEETYKVDSVNAPIEEGEVPETSSPEVDTKYHYFVIADNKLVNVTRVCLDGSEPPESQISHVGTDKYDRSRALAQEGNLAEAFAYMSEKIRLERLTEGKMTLDPIEGVLLYQDGPVRHQFSTQMATRLVKKVKAGEDVTGILRFAERLIHNPSKRAVNELYSFLVASEIEITDDGMVRCFKKVTSEYKDCRTRTFDNSPGVTVSLPRFMVDDNADNLCSAGLHVCSRAYLSHFGGQRVISVLVDPADFVSVPNDYYEIDGSEVKAKARVWKYYVEADITDTTGLKGENYQHSIIRSVDDGLDEEEDDFEFEEEYEDGY